LFVALPACGEAEPTAVASCPVRAAPSMNEEPFRFTELELSHGSSCGLGNDGSVVCWGSEDPGASALPDVSRAIAIEVDLSGGWAIRDGGSVLRWQGRDERLTVPGVCDATAITENRCAVVADGQARCWNVRNPTQLGLSESSVANGRAVTVPGVSGAVSLASGPSAYTCAGLEDGSVTCWGGGPRQSDRPGPAPATVPELSDVRDIVGSQDGSLAPNTGEMCAILLDGGVTCWTHAKAPARIPGLADVVSLSISMSHGCAALADGSAVCWGANQSGQLGNGTTEASDTPVPVSDLSGVVRIATASHDSTIGHSCAILTDGTAWCWGAQQFGSWSDGNVADSSLPVRVDVNLR
jgi:alpha-tubulin suppressor-like RCC1 family protein